ncbi:helix-turn-helix domain-containing protein [Agrobacterium tumefaciens]|uniref:helix-turn-helix domain-containing protein n=1 Tax=Agrobacterium tumefaciens TaxID=358 RepID=UPI001F37A2CE|nr:helix-turn-helix domain-containing protein [Agrobacterium tumefaciens]
MSENSHARLVQNETGLTFGRWRQQLQVIVAIRSLAAGATVQQVSGDLGYQSVSAFITIACPISGKFRPLKVRKDSDTPEKIKHVHPHHDWQQ